MVCRSTADYSMPGRENLYDAEQSQSENSRRRVWHGSESQDAGRPRKSRRRRHLFTSRRLLPRARAVSRVIEHLPYESDSFELVTALDVIEHLDDDVAGLREMRRVLRRDGRLLVFVPAFMFLWGVHDDISNHRRRYTLKELRSVVSEAGMYHSERFRTSRYPITG